MNTIELVGIALPGTPAVIAWVAIAVTGFGIALHAALIGWGIHVMAGSNKGRAQSFEESRRENERRHQADLKRYEAEAKRHEAEAKRHEETMTALMTLIERTGGSSPTRPAGAD